jgi:hypothetical protein
VTDELEVKMHDKVSMSEEGKLLVKAVRIVVKKSIYRGDGERWSSDTHKAVRFLLNRIGYTEEQAQKVDPEKSMMDLVETEMSRLGVAFDGEPTFAEWLDSFRAYALLEHTFYDKTPLDERLDFK